MNRRPVITRTPQDDTVNIAGWVFADLLLSLSVIFLTSISFAVPGLTGDSVKQTENSGQILELQTNNSSDSPLVQGFNFYYSKFNKAQIEDDLKSYFNRKNLSPNTIVIYAQIVGGYDAATEGSEMGTMRALEFSIALKKAQVNTFEGANFDLTTSSSLNPKQVALRLSFAPPLKVTN